MKRFVKSKQEWTEIITVLLLTLIWNEFVYLGTRLFTKSWHHYDLTTAFDRLVPFVPWTVLIYLGCFIVWFISYLLCALQESEKRRRFFCAEVISKGVCLIFFLLMPTTNVRPEVVDKNFCGFLMNFVYWIDAPDNLFPSLHCLVSWFCWIGVRKRQDISSIYRCFTLITAIAVCVVTLTTKQHVIADVISGVLLAEVSYMLAGIPKVLSVYTKIVSWLMEFAPAKMRKEN